MPDFLSRYRSRWMTLLSLLAAILVLAWWRSEGTPQPVVEAASSKLQCVSYAPFRKPGETPLNPDTTVSPQRLREDLSILASRSQCVRTYSVIQGLDRVPEVARSLGMKVLLGVWIGRERDKNDIEIERAVRLAHEYPDTVQGIVVGNEVLLRREQSAEQMGRYIDQVRNAVDVPVTYADVWEFWSQNASLARHVSFVTVHILPYWEDHPVGIHDAIDHITGTAERMRRIFNGKDVLIGETGWPSQGRQRESAVASRVNEARFMRAFSRAAAEHHLKYNFIEGFDQPWKRGQEGAMGGNWGVFDSDGHLKFPATGPVAEDPHWYLGWLGAMLGLLAAAGLMRAWRGQGLRTWVQALALGTTTGGLLAAQLRYGVVWNRNLLEWGTTTVFGLMSMLMMIWVLRLLVQSRTGRLGEGGLAGRRLPAGYALWCRRRAHFDTLDWLGVCRSFFLFAAAIMTLLLVVDARYRGFPTVLYLLPLLGLAMLRLGGLSLAGEVEERVLAGVCVLGSIAFVLMEGLSNGQSIVFGLVCVLLAALASDGRFWLPGPQQGQEAGRSSR
ncbi:MAG: hypothetical protein Q4B13_05620 [Lautropia sp.]|nr:hypothetical protein [Lautropia sp.]